MCEIDDIPASKALFPVNLFAHVVMSTVSNGMYAICREHKCILKIIL